MCVQGFALLTHSFSYPVLIGNIASNHWELHTYTHSVLISPKGASEFGCLQR